jgi:hypothetical protein
MTKTLFFRTAEDSRNGLSPREMRQSGGQDFRLPKLGRFRQWMQSFDWLELRSPIIIGCIFVGVRLV